MKPPQIKKLVTSLKKDILKDSKYSIQRAKKPAPGKRKIESTRGNQLKSQGVKVKLDNNNTAYAVQSQFEDDEINILIELEDDHGIKWGYVKIIDAYNDPTVFHDGAGVIVKELTPFLIMLMNLLMLSEMRLI